MAGDRPVQVPVAGDGIMLDPARLETRPARTAAGVDEAASPRAELLDTLAGARGGRGRGFTGGGPWLRSAENNEQRRRGSEGKRNGVAGGSRGSVGALPYPLPTCHRASSRAGAGAGGVQPERRTRGGQGGSGCTGGRRRGRGGLGGLAMGRASTVLYLPFNKPFSIFCF